MNRRTFCMTALLLAVAPCLAQRNFDSVKIKATHVAGAVHMLEGSGGNIGISVGKDGVLMIDDQFAPLAEKIEAAIKDVSGGRGSLKFVVNTHWHGDHTGGNPHFGRSATIVAHDNVLKRLSTRQTMRAGAQQRVSEPIDSAGWPVITFDDSLSIHFNGEEIKVMHLPNGHTDGDSVVYFTKSKVLHMGDDFFAGKFPFVDLSSAGSVEGLARNVAHVLERVPDDVKVIPGHGALSTVDDLKAFHQMLVETTQFVRERMKAGKTLDQIKAEGFPSEWDSFDGGFISAARWIDTIHASLSAPAGS